MVCLDRPYHFRFFKGCYPQILLGPFLNTLTHLKLLWIDMKKFTLVAIKLILTFPCIFVLESFLSSMHKKVS